MTATHSEQPERKRRTADENVQLLEDAIDKFNAWTREKHAQRKRRA